MQRPVMSPSFAEEDVSPKRRWADLLRPAWRGIRWSARLLLADIFSRRGRLKVELGAPFTRFLRGACYRMLFLPLALVLASAALVYSGTHPGTVVAAIDPSCQGLNYDAVDFLGEGGVKLEGWLVPVLDAKRVLADKDKTLAERRPAIILLHDYGASRQQMLPLVRPLHAAGYVVLLTTLRGSAAGTSAGATFGLNEAGDAQAAIEFLRRTPFVDARKISLLGVGTGANAAMIVAQKDPGIAALILDKPCRGFDEVLRDHIGPRQPWMRWINPLCQWTFEIGYGVNSSELNLAQSFHTLQGRNASLRILLFDGPTPTCLKPAKVPSIVDFLDASCGMKHGQLAAQSAAVSGRNAR